MLSWKKKGSLSQNKKIPKKPKPYKKPAKKLDLKLKNLLWLSNKYIKYGKTIKPNGIRKKGGKSKLVKIPHIKNFKKIKKLTYFFYFYWFNSSRRCFDHFKL